MNIQIIFIKIFIHKYNVQNISFSLNSLLVNFKIRNPFTIDSKGVSPLNQMKLFKAIIYYIVRQYSIHLMIE